MDVHGKTNVLQGMSLSCQQRADQEQIAGSFSVPRLSCRRNCHAIFANLSDTFYSHVPLSTIAGFRALEAVPTCQRQQKYLSKSSIPRALLAEQVASLTRNKLV
jgi:hypothetical protein